jgi:O-antigen ligase
MRRAMPPALGAIFAIVPIFPSFIALTGVNFPGLSLLPRPAIFAAIAFCALLAIYALVTLARYPKRGAQPLLLPLLAVFFAGLIAGIAGYDPTAGLLFTFIGGLGIVWHASVMRFYADRDAALAIFWAFLASGVVACTVAVAMVVARYPAGQYALQHGRATGTFILPGELAGYLIVLLPIAFALGCVGRRSLRPLAWIAFAVGLATLFLTFSRAGWMGCAAAFAFLLATRVRHGAGAAAAVLAGGALVVVLLFNAHHDPSEDYTRISIWQTAMQIIDRFPLTGVGPFNFSRLYALLRAPDGDATAFHAHSLYLTFFAEFGIVGLTAATWTFARFAAELRRRLASAPAATGFVALGVAAGLLGVAVQGLIDTVSVVIFGLWFPTLALALAAASGGDPDPAAEG